MKNQIQFLGRAARVAIIAACSLFALVAFAPSAYARVMPDPSGSPVGASPQTAPLPRTAPIVVHNVVTGGMAGWQIALIAVAAGLLTATLAVFADRARRAHRNISVSAA